MAKKAVAAAPPAAPAITIRNRIKELRQVKAADLIPNPENWRRHPDRQRRAMRGLLKELGYVDALIARETGDGKLILLDGHLRAATTPNDVVPVLVLDVTEAEGRKILATLDPLAAMAESDDDALKLLTSKVSTSDKDLATLMHLVHDENVGIDLAAQVGGPLPVIDDGKTDLERALEAKGLAGPDPITEPAFEALSDTLPGMLQLKDNMYFPPAHDMGWPGLREDRLLQELPKPIDTWGDHLNTPDDGITTWLYNFGTVPSAGLPFDRAILAFFSWDQKFENWWHVPSLYVSKMLNAGLRTAVMPDFSLWSDEAKAVHLFNVYRNLWLTRYMQEAGITMIPRAGGYKESMWDYCWAGIPQPSPVVAFQLQTIPGGPDADTVIGQRIDGLKEMFRRFTPKQALVYGGQFAQTILDKVGPSCEIILVDTAANKRGRKARQARGAL